MSRSPPRRRSGPDFSRTDLFTMFDRRTKHLQEQSLRRNPTKEPSAVSERLAVGEPSTVREPPAVPEPSAVSDRPAVAVPPPKLEEWPDIASEAAGSIDVSELSGKQIEDVLRLFDLNPAYGPFVGIDRSKRWERAQQWGLQPPQIIYKILETREHVERREAGYLW